MVTNMMTRYYGKPGSIYTVINTLMYRSRLGTSELVPATAASQYVLSRLCDVKSLCKLVGRLSSIEELVPVIKGTDIGKVILSQVEKSSLGEFSKSLWLHLASTIRYLTVYVPERYRPSIHVFLRRYDLRNVIIVLTSLTAGTKVKVEDLIPLGTIASRGLLAKLCDVTSVNDLVEVLRECDLGRYGDLIEKLGNEVKEVADLLPLESRLYWQYVYDLRIYGEPLLELLAGIEYDLKLILNVLRCKAMGVEEYLLSRIIPQSGYLLSSREVSRILNTTTSDVATVLRETIYGDLSKVRFHEVTDFEHHVESYFLNVVEYVARRPQFTISDIVSVMLLKEMEVKILRTLISSIVFSPRG